MAVCGAENLATVLADCERSYCRERQINKSSMAARIMTLESLENYQRLNVHSAKSGTHF